MRLPAALLLARPLLLLLLLAHLAQRRESVHPLPLPRLLLPRDEGSSSHRALLPLLLPDVDAHRMRPDRAVLVARRCYRPLRNVHRSAWFRSAVAAVVLRLSARSRSDCGGALLVSLRSLLLRLRLLRLDDRHLLDEGRDHVREAARLEAGGKLGDKVLHEQADADAAAVSLQQRGVGKRLAHPGRDAAPHVNPRAVRRKVIHRVSLRGSPCGFFLLEAIAVLLSGAANASFQKFVRNASDFLHQSRHAIAAVERLLVQPVEH
mmetsp:Transcript_40840/g.96988  ORF Transcript_40840/g.96988 Transcript_40840/m.96988 type:complete len:263 (+) Transcript_40840:567-1355(+)